MARCQNCTIELACSCQAKIASNGQSCCGSCLYAYEQALISSPSSVAVAGPPANKEIETYKVSPTVINSITHYNNY